MRENVKNEIERDREEEGKRERPGEREK